jgi:catechol 2,3-dioxygenase-like lactoylglutathione lyase family enzyme
VSDRTRPFVIVLIEDPRSPSQAPALRQRSGKPPLPRQDRPSGTLTGFSHLGIGCDSRAEVDRRAELARHEGRTVRGPLDSGPPVGYWAFIADPDGNNLELSYGQEVGITVDEGGF